MAEEGTRYSDPASTAVAPEPDDGQLDQGTAEEVAPIDENDFQALLDSPAHNFRSLARGDVVEGQIVRIDPDEILVDIGLKSEGVIAGRERGSDDDVASLKLGDTVLVYVMQPESPEGHAVLSLRRAKMEKSWRIADGILERAEIIESKVVDCNKGGLIVDVHGLRGFVPISQVLNLRRDPGERTDSGEDELVRKLSEMVGRHLQLEIIELNRNRNRLILSERVAAQKVRQLRKDELMNELQVGQVRKGKVSNLCNFGAFVDLGGADGLIHISQLSWGHLNHPNQVLKVGDDVDVYVLGIDPVKKKIALSLKRAQADPWDSVDERYQIGQEVPGTVTKITSFGAFARVEDGIEGLAHVSELASRHITNPKEVVQEGETYTFKIIHIDGRKRRLGLSLRAMEEGSDYVQPDALGDSDNQWAAVRDAVSAADDAPASSESATEATAKAEQAPSAVADHVEAPPPVAEAVAPEPETTAATTEAEAAPVKRSRRTSVKAEAAAPATEAGKAVQEPPQKE
jgi:small subunit ribosomal protein S1